MFPIAIVDAFLNAISSKLHFPDTEKLATGLANWFAFLVKDAAQPLSEAVKVTLYPPGAGYL